jgi:hypothetical protein
MDKGGKEEEATPEGRGLYPILRFPDRDYPKGGPTGWRP